MNEKILTSSNLKERKIPELDRKQSEPIRTSDLDEGKIRRNQILARATEEELDRFAEMIRPRIEREDQLVILQCSKCGTTIRNRRKTIGSNCSNCARKAYVMEGEEDEPGVFVELKGKELEAFLESERREQERYLKQIEEQKQAQAILAKAGFIPGVSK